MRYWSLFLFAYICSPALAEEAKNNECLGVIALSKTKTIITISKNDLDNNAATFCSEYNKSSGNQDSRSLEGAYDTLKVNFGSSGASKDEISSKVCSSSNRSLKSDSAYAQYIEYIAPGAYSSYDHCMTLKNLTGLKYDVDASSVLPKQFSMTASYTQQHVQAKTTSLRYSASKGIACTWDGANRKIVTINGSTSAQLDCSRKNQSERGYVKVISVTDTHTPPLTIPWQAYDKDGIPFAENIQALQNKLKSAIAHGNENRKLLVSHGYETIIEFWKGYVNLILGTYTGAKQFKAGTEIAMSALKKTQDSKIFSETGSIKQSIQLLNDPNAIQDRATLQTTLGAAFVDMDKALKDFSNRPCC